MLADQHILKHRHIIEEPNILKSAGNTSRHNLVWTRSSYRMTRQANITRCRFIDACNKVKNRGLARTVWANDADNLSRVNNQVHILNRNQATEALRHSGQF